MELHHHRRHHPPNGCVISARALTLDTCVGVGRGPAACTGINPLVVPCHGLLAAAVPRRVHHQHAPEPCASACRGSMPRTELPYPGKSHTVPPSGAGYRLGTWAYIGQGGYPSGTRTPRRTASLSGLGLALRRAPADRVRLAANLTSSVPCLASRPVLPVLPLASCLVGRLVLTSRGAVGSPSARCARVSRLLHSHRLPSLSSAAPS